MDFGFGLEIQNPFFGFWNSEIGLGKVTRAPTAPAETPIGDCAGGREEMASLERRGPGSGPRGGLGLDLALAILTTANLGLGSLFF